MLSGSNISISAQVIDTLKVLDLNNFDPSALKHLRHILVSDSTSGSKFTPIKF